MSYIFRIRVILNEDQFENIKKDPEYTKYPELMTDIYQQIICQILESK